MSQKVLIANEIIADGEVRTAGKIYTLADATAAYLIGLGKGRTPTEDEIARLGVADTLLARGAADIATDRVEIPVAGMGKK